MSDLNKVFVTTVVAMAVVLTVITLAFSRERELPQSADVRDLKCQFTPSTGVVGINATIVNSTDEARDYEVLVVFVTKAGSQVGSENLVARDAKPGQKVQVRTRGTFVPGNVPDHCEVA